MAMCKYCGIPFAWGKTDDGRFVPLVPVGEDQFLERTFQDENGLLRADHRVVCVWRGGPTVRVSRLVRAVAPNDIIGFSDPDPETGEIKPKRRARTRK